MLKKAISRLSEQLDKDNVILIGGYKGLLHSIERKSTAVARDDSQKTEGAVFLDQETWLPHGIAEIEWT